MADEFSTPDFPCLPKISFNLPNIALSVNLPKPYLAVTVDITLSCPFDNAPVSVDVGVETVVPVPSVSLSIT